MAVRSAVINVMVNAALKASPGLVRDFGETEQLQASRKGPAGFVAAARRRAEGKLRRELGRARPGHGLSIEGGQEEAGTDPRHRWLVAPLDGALNFLHGLPHVAISIALEGAGNIEAAVVHDPVRHETFWAEKGIGSYMNDRRLRVSARRALADTLIATGAEAGPGRTEERRLTHLGAVAPQVAGLRRSGAASLDLAYVAAGRYDGFWDIGLGPWALAAGLLLVREAGGFVTTFDGGREVLAGQTVVAANGTIHLALGRLLDTAPTPARAAAG